ncbi:cyclin-D3-3-like isoform X2 [Olea europaea var. sylvestris]|uniref:cyclin-D3-3-like isoform X2 n=1 Tax=Olea europaea var. sylvestris TaxID=158386 RepID=UPI000C1D5949|nr:cyclin-D3-3-like isoform X2 [Olea europaea var. sylvestris]
MAIEKKLDSDSSFFDALYCEEEEKWSEVEEKESEIIFNNHFNGNFFSVISVLLTEQDLFWDDEELQSLFCKEKETFSESNNNVEFEFSLCLARKQAVEWILKVNAHYGFSALTAILAVNYLDRFLYRLHFQKDKPWMIQLAAVTCLSLAAKVENTNYVFEPKTIQRMELLVLSALKWRMNPVTPLSFLDHTIRRLGLKSYIHLEFVRKCENLIFSIMPDSRFARYLPSVVATATMLRFIHQVEPCTAAIDYENQLLGILKINMEQVKDCSELISETSKTGPFLQKRGFCEVPSSPNGMDALSFSSDSSSDSCGVASCISSSASSSAHQPLLKKRRVQEQQMKLPSLSRVIVDAVGSPR